MADMTPFEMLVILLFVLGGAFIVLYLDDWRN